MDKKNAARDRWSKVHAQLSSAGTWSRYGEPLTQYTAKASYIERNDGTGEVSISGTIENIDRRDTIGRLCCGEKVARGCWRCGSGNCRYSIPLVNMVAIFASLLVLTHTIDVGYSFSVGILWFLLPLHLIFICNRKLMNHIWRRSAVPWIQVFVPGVQTYALCDLCNWDARIWVVAPPLILSQFMLIVADAVYFKPSQKNILRIIVVECFLWQVAMVAAVRMNWFPNLRPRNLFVVMLDGGSTPITINNAALFSSKAMSVLVCLFGQMYFRCKYLNRMYSLRSHYTMKQNAEWERSKGTTRASKKSKLKTEVAQTQLFLSDTDIIILHEDDEAEMEVVV